MKWLLATLAFLTVFCLILTPSAYAAASAFPKDGVALKYVTERTLTSSKWGNMSEHMVETLTFHKTGTQWNVNDLIVGKVSCPPSVERVVVEYLTKSGTLNATTDVHIEASFVMNDFDRAIVSTSAGSSTPLGFLARCYMQGDSGLFIQEYSYALSAASGYYADFYISNNTKPGGVVRVGKGVVSLALKNVTFSGSTLPVLYGKGQNDVGYYYDRATGILLWAEGSTLSSTTSSRYMMTLLESTVLIPEFPSFLTVLASMIVTVTLVTIRRKANDTSVVSQSNEIRD